MEHRLDLSHAAKLLGILCAAVACACSSQGTASSDDRACASAAGCTTDGGTDAASHGGTDAASHGGTGAGTEPIGTAVSSSGEGGASGSASGEAAAGAPQLNVGQSGAAGDQNIAGEGGTAGEGGVAGLLSCEPGSADCDDNPSDCETSASNPQSCGTSCETKRTCSSTNGTATCTQGVCAIQCAAGYADCGVNDGCETSLTAGTTCGESCADMVACDALSAASCINGGCRDDWAGWPMPNDSTQPGSPNPESYKNNGDGTVTDNVTGLIWQQHVDIEHTYDLPAALAHCQALSLAGHHDWRLPSTIELVSILDYDQQPTIDPAFFPNEPGGNFWSSTGFRGFATTSMAVDFWYGSVAYSGNDSKGAARCVR